MPGARHEALWPARLRWRLRGAWQGPAFVICTLLDAVILTELPFAGDSGRFVASFLLAGFLNLAVVAVLAPLGGRVVRRRRPHLPREIATDAAGATLLVTLTAVLLAAGLAHRPAVRDADADFAAQREAVRRFFGHQAPAEYRANLDRATTWKPGPDLFRTCVPGDDPDRALCVLVRTDQSPPGITIDPDRRPNSAVSGPDNPGRSGR